MTQDQQAIINDLIEYANSSRSSSQNEAETRHKIIDTVLQEFLSWPRNRLKVEPYIDPGFADYVLTKPNGDHLFFIEAKRSGVYFELPRAHLKGETSAYIQIKKLLTDKNIKDAMTQVRDYCMNTGCEYAAITNGHEWILFKTFVSGKRWDSLNAFVIRKLEFFRDEYTNALNHLSYISISERSSLVQLLTSLPPKDRQIFYPKERVEAYSHSINANRLGAFLRPIVSHFFGVIGDGETEFMNRCYVSERDYSHAVDSMRILIQDALTPYFQQFGVQQLDDTGKGGAIGGRLTKNIKKNRGGEVLTLFGGKGAGKSTFIKRLLHHMPPKWLREHAVVSIVDLLNIPEDQTLVRETIWDELVKRLDTDEVLLADRDVLLSELFAVKFETAKGQELFGLSPASEAYNIKLNALVSDWKSNKKYCAAQLKDYWSKKGRGVIVVIDNTDQFTGALQDFCFTSAQEIAQHLKCVTLISMREERFHNSKTHGVLDAFQNAGFHISSPQPSSVFIKRIEYTIELLRNRRRRSEITDCADEGLIKDACRYLEIIKTGLTETTSPLNTFLTACGHGDIRLSLDLFRSFLLSGYTNVEEMLSAGTWTFQTHQVIKPVMIPTRYFYAEQLSDIPNIYQLRDTRHSSHFTAMRILRKLRKGVVGHSASFVDMAELRSYFAETFNMVSDLEANLNILLRHGFVEANNRIDQFTDDVDQVRITSYGRYMFEELAYYFTYTDLVCIDCGIHDEAISNYLTESAKDEYKLFQKNKRTERVAVRLQRVEHFLKYLAAEEEEEIKRYGLEFPDEERFTYRALNDFEVEKTQISESAVRQEQKRTLSRRPRG